MPVFARDRILPHLRRAYQEYRLRVGLWLSWSGKAEKHIRRFGVACYEATRRQLRDAVWAALEALGLAARRGPGGAR